MKLLDPLKLKLEKNILIEASAGTGKTYTITTLFTRLVAMGFSVDSILVVTFTEAAAAELKQRIRQRLASALHALETFDSTSSISPKPLKPLKPSNTAKSTIFSNSTNDCPGCQNKKPCNKADMDIRINTCREKESEPDTIKHNTIKHDIIEPEFSKIDLVQEKIEDELVLYLLKGSKEDIARTKSRIKQGIICFDEASIMTIHSFCFKILRENAFETQVLFNIKLIPDTRTIIREIAMDFMAIEINNLDPLFLRYLKQKNFKVQTLISIFTRALSRSGIAIIPENTNFCHDASRDYINICHRLLKVLQKDKEEIMEIFFTHPGVNKRSYNKKNIRKWLDTAEDDLIKFCLKFNGKTIIKGSDKFSEPYKTDIYDKKDISNGIILDGKNLNKTDKVKNSSSSVYSNPHIFNMSEKGDSLYKFTISRLKEKNKQKEPVPEHIFFELCEKLLEISNIFEKNIIALKIKFFSFASKEIENKKQGLGICFFDDMVNGLADALEGENSDILVSIIRKKYMAGLIDEFQDTDQRQYLIFSKIFSKTNSPFCMIGDPKQAIYAFRGGDIFAYLRAVKDTCGRAYTLEKNWRSAPALVNSVNTVFMQSESPFYFKEIGFTPVKTPESAEDRFMQNRKFSPPFKFLFINTKTADIDKQGFIKKNWAEKNIPLIIARDITRLLLSEAEIKSEDNHYSRILPGDIAVLVRTNNQAEKINQALTSMGIPSYISKTGSVFDSSEALAMADLLAAVLEPEEPGLIKASLCSDLFNLSDIDIFLLDPYNVHNSDLMTIKPASQQKCGNQIITNNYHSSHISDHKNDMIFAEEKYSNSVPWHKWQKKFKNWKVLWGKNGIIRMLQEIFYSQEVMADGNSVGERALTNYYHLAELLHRAETEKHFSPFLLFKWFLDQLVPDMREEYSDELRLETDSSATAIITIHKSKGMEYPVVYLPYLHEGVVHAEKDENPVFHDLKDNNREKIDFGSEKIDLSRQRAVFEEEAENMRLLYVGLTRAASMCRILWGNFKSVDKSALGKLINRQGIFSEKEMLDNIQKLVEKSNNGISIDFYENNMNDKPWRKDDIDNTMDFSCRKCKSEIKSEWQFSSFSRLAATHKPEYGNKNFSEIEPEFELESKIKSEIEPEYKFEQNKSPNAKISLIDFPKGTIPGELIHGIFEHIDFQDDSNKIKNIIELTLLKYGFDTLKWINPLVKAFSEILETPLYHGDKLYNAHGSDPNFTDRQVKTEYKTDNFKKKLSIANNRFNKSQNIFSLKDIKKNKRLNEMEFILPFKSFSPKILADIFTKNMNHPAASPYAQKISELKFSAFKGFMKGFIDLVFKFKNKWYIVDYKSNYLGDAYSDYSLTAMTKAMMEHHYFLQYHIYITAVHRYLELKLEDYDYNSGFGGVLYLFVRGMHPDYGSEFGIFRDKPDYELIKKLSELF